MYGLSSQLATLEPPRGRDHWLPLAGQSPRCRSAPTLLASTTSVQRKKYLYAKEMALYKTQPSNSAAQRLQLCLPPSGVCAGPFRGAPGLRPLQLCQSLSHWAATSPSNGKQVGQNPSGAGFISRASREEATNRATYYKILQPSIISLLFTSLSALHRPGCDRAVCSNTALGYFLLSKSTLQNSKRGFVKQSLKKKKYTTRV